MADDKQKKMYVKLSPDLLSTVNISQDEFQNHLEQLSAIMKSKIRLFIPDVINSSVQISFLVNLSTNLQKLKSCDGFEEHISKYTKKQIHSNYFVTVIASSLVDKVSNIVLEPSILGKKKKPDILVDYKGEHVYIECKLIDTTKFDYTAEHEFVLSILLDYIDVPHQVDIRYQKPLSLSELHDLGKTLKQRLHKITARGAIIDNDNLYVWVEKREDYLKKGVKVDFWGMEKDLKDNCSYPMHSYGRDGHTISVSGPRVDYSKYLKAKIAKSRSQAPIDKSFILMIDARNMLGSKTENVRALVSAFQPEMNTRFSAATLVEYYPQLGSSGFSIDYDLISNPFTQYPISSAFSQLFSSSSTQP